MLPLRVPVACALLLALAGLLVGCGNYDPEARLIRRAMTKIEDVAVEPPGTDRQEILDETAPAEGGNAVQQAIEDPFCRPGEVDNRLPRCHARNIAVVLNTLTFFLVGVVDRVLEEPPTFRPEGRRVWGPIFLGGNSIRLDVERNPDDTFSYCVHFVDRFVPRNSRAAREITCADDVNEATGLRLVLTGDVEPSEDGEGLRSGAGTLIFDADALREVSGSQLRGTFTIRYDNVTRAGERSIDIDIDNIPLQQEPFETGARYRFAVRDDNSGTFQFGLRADAEFVPNGSPQVLERFDITAQWQSDFAGRADSRISGGDLGDNAAFQTQCWGSDLRTTFYEDLSRSLGSADTCVFAEPLAAVSE